MHRGTSVLRGLWLSRNVILSKWAVRVAPPTQSAWITAGYRYQSDDSSRAIIAAIFDHYKDFGGPLMATKNTARSGDHVRTFVYKTVTYEPLPDSLFELPPAVKALMKH
jgi:hypothetical protein